MEVLSGVGEVVILFIGLETGHVDCTLQIQSQFITV